MSGLIVTVESITETDEKFQNIFGGTKFLLKTELILKMKDGVNGNNIMSRQKQRRVRVAI